MHTLFLGFFICVLFQPFKTQFLTGPASIYLNYTRQSFACSRQIDTFYNGTNTITGQNSIVIGTCYYCFIAIVTLLVNNLTKTITFRDGIVIWNSYRNMAINQCNFSTTMDIGYGSCTPYYFETATSIQLCICSANNCTDTYSSCQASVNQALSSPPPLLPILQPTLSNTITCQDSDANYSAANNITPPMYAGCQYANTLSPIDYSKCYTYTPNHTVLCQVSYDPTQGSYQQTALIESEYEGSIFATLEVGASSAINGSGNYQYQTSTSIVSIWSSGGSPYNWALCLCTTNNCNVDFATCTSGMNIPSYLLPYNGSTSTAASTSSTSTGATISSGSTVASTSSTSTGANISYGSTTRLTTSASMPNGTTLQSSTATSVITSITTSAIGVGNSNTLPSNRPSSSMGEKLFYLKLLVALILALSLSLFKISNAIDLC